MVVATGWVDPKRRARERKPAKPRVQEPARGRSYRSWVRVSRFGRDRVSGGVVNTHTTKVRDFFETDAYLSRNPIVPIRARLVSELLSDLRGGSVVDLGCGDGAFPGPCSLRTTR